MDKRFQELTERLVAPGRPADHFSCSELHELYDFIKTDQEFLMGLNAKKKFQVGQELTKWKDLKRALKGYYIVEYTWYSGLLDEHRKSLGLSWFMKKNTFKKALANGDTFTIVEVPKEEKC